jgi:DNA-binding SARP family transcriptional activator
LKNISFDVDELSRLSKIEQAQRLEEAERRIDEVQRAAADDPDSLNWVSQQRQYLVDMQHMIFEC